MSIRRSSPVLFAPLLLCSGLCLGGCLGVGAVNDSPPLVGFDEPVGLLEEPDDEAARRALPAGCFTGLEVTDARRTLEALLGESQGLLVSAVIENSPGAAADVREDDLLLAAIDEHGTEVWLEWPSQWRELELAGTPGAELTVVLDRAGLELERTLTLEARVHPAEREPAPRWRESRAILRPTSCCYRTSRRPNRWWSRCGSPSTCSWLWRWARFSA